MNTILKSTVILCLLLKTIFVFGWNAPSILSPSNGATTWTGITLDWNAVANSEKYQVEIDTSELFNSPVNQLITNDYINSSSGNDDTRYFASDLFFGKTYYWRVRACVAGDTSSWTQSSFITRNYVTLSSPANESLNWTGLTLDWDAHSSVDFYDVEVDTSLNFDSPVLIQASNTYINSSSGNNDTQYYASDLFFGKTYYWRVRARNAVDTSAWSFRSFQTKDYVTLSSPANESLNWTGLTLDWDAHSSVDFYDVEVDTSLNFDSPVLIQASNTYINSSSGNNDTQYYASDLFFGKTYYWRVRARNAVDTSAWSFRSFQTKDYVTLSSPANESLNWTGLTLDWDAHSSVDFYDVEVDTSLNFDSPVLIQATNTYVNSSSGNDDTRYFASDLFFGKTYYWRVRARNAVDTSAWSFRSFQTKDYVTLSSPANESLNWTGLTLDWDAHSSVDFYDVEVDTSLNFDSPVLIQASNTYINSSSGNDDTRYFASDLFFGKTYYWRVRARNAVDTSVWTARSFQTKDYVSLNTPANGQLNISVSGIYIDWDAHPSITFYQFQFDTLSTFNSPFLVNQNIDYINSSSGNNDTKYYTGALFANQVYYWKVRAINAVDTCEWTNRYFSTGNCQEPGLISGNSEICESSSNTYSISSVTGANSYNWVLPSGWIGTSTTNSISATSSANSGNITVSVNNSCGVSSEQTFFVNVNQTPNTPNISLNGNILHSDAEAGNQWYDQNGLISGATNQDYMVTVDGEYYVIVTLNTCVSDTSNILNVVLTGIEFSESNKNLLVYPNPASSELCIEYNQANENLSIQIINSMGEIVFSSYFKNNAKIQTNNFASGVYLLRIGNDKYYTFKKFIKE